MLEAFRSLLDPKSLKRLVVLVAPSVAAWLIVASWPTLDVQSTAHEALRAIGAPGHGVTDEIGGWLQSSSRGPLIRGFLAEWLPYLVGSLFALGGALRPLGNGNASAVAWMLTVPATAVGGRAVIFPAIMGAVGVFVFLILRIALAGGSHAESESNVFDLRDLSFMAVQSVLYALVQPFLPVMILFALVQRSVTWPYSEPTQGGHRPERWRASTFSPVVPLLGTDRTSAKGRSAASSGTESVSESGPVALTRPVQAVPTPTVPWG